MGVTRLIGITKQFKIDHVSSFIKITWLNVIVVIRFVGTSLFFTIVLSMLQGVC